MGQAVSGREQLADEELAARAKAGDREAFAGLYERYFTGIYDFAARVTRDRDAAADVAQSTFTKAWSALGRRPEPPRHVKSWLYAIAHNCAIDELRYRKRLVLGAALDSDDGEDLAFTQVDPSRLSDPAEALRDKELVELVWDAAQALAPQEYALLDLHLRRDLSADELAETLGLDKGAVYTRLSRLRSSLEESVTTAVLLRRGRRDCPELGEFVSTLSPDRLTREARLAVKAHVEGCSRCQQSRRRYAAPAAILAGLAPVPVSPELRLGVWDAVERGLGPGVQVRPPARARPGTPWKLVAIAAVVIVATVAGVLLASGGSTRPSDPDDVHSTSHRLRIASTDPVVVVAWGREPTARAYSITWTRGRQDLPDAMADLGGDAVGSRSPTLAPGTWYFHLRTRGEGGAWTSTVHLGPFVIERLQAEPSEPVPSAVEASEPDDESKPAKKKKKKRKKEVEQPSTEPVPAETQQLPPAESEPAGAQEQEPPREEPPATQVEEETQPPPEPPPPPAVPTVEAQTQPLPETAAPPPPPTTQTPPPAQPPSDGQPPPSH